MSTEEAASAFSDKDPLPSGLVPAERMALTVARAQVGRGENPPIGVATVLVMALDRLTGHKDWTQEAGDET